MSAATPELVRRLYLRLLEEGRERGGGDFPRLTVANLYQDLVPYRSVRSELGVFELAQYEDALVRLLAGEGGYLRVADEGARAELAAELRSANPILGIYRDYASMPVELLREEDQPRPVLSLHRADEPSAAVPEGPREEVRDVDDFVDDDLADALLKPQPLPADATRLAGHPLPRGPAVPPAGAVREGERRCPVCGRFLPEIDGVRFCPHCGSDQTAVPCERCGTAVRAEWNFCIRCGTRRPAESVTP